MAKSLPPKVAAQMRKAGLPTGGQVPFVPRLASNRRGIRQIVKAPVLYGPKAGKIGYVDSQGRIWIKDRAHADDPDHWDVQENGGRTYFRVGLNGDLLP